MKLNQDDAVLEINSRTEIDPQPSPPPGIPEDIRRAVAQHLSVDQFFDGSRERTFQSLGRVSVENEEVFPWHLDPERRKVIQAKVKGEAETKGEIAPFDILAFAAEGCKPSSPLLEDANRRWWKMRQDQPLWRVPSRPNDTSFFQRLQDWRAQRISGKIIREAGFDGTESKELFKTDGFSRRTVYTRDYSVIPRGLRALFNMVPYVIFSPRNRQQLQRFLAYASKNRIKVAPRGRGTWALGGALLTKGGVVLELASFEKKIRVDAAAKRITVTASVDFQEAEEALSHHNLTLGARPSNKYAAIAGFLSVGEPLQGGLGLNAFGFGPIRDAVDSIRVVTSTGEEKILDDRADEFGYYFGTNGRYGIITEITLTAMSKPPKHFPVALHFQDPKNAFEFLQTFQEDLQSGYLKVRPVHVEFFGAAYLDGVNKLKRQQEKTITVNLIAPESIKRISPSQDTVLFLFYEREDSQAFSRYLENRNGVRIAPEAVAAGLWQERFSPMKLRKKGDLLTAEVILPLQEVPAYLKEITVLAAKLGVEILPVAYVLNSHEVLVLPQFLTDRRYRFQYYRHFSLVPVLARRAIRRFCGRPYGYGIWLSGLAKTALGDQIYRDLMKAKARLDPNGILNPGKLGDIRSRFWDLLGKFCLHQSTVDFLDVMLRFQGYLSRFKTFRETFLSAKAKPYVREHGDALHRCIKCSACMICPLAQIWEKSGDPELAKDAVYITPRYKMEYMQQHLFEGKRLTQEDVDRFVLCFRCGVAERETVCPISDMLLETGQSESSPCQKKLPTYDDFEARLRKEGYDVDGAIQRYLDILKSHPGVARAMKEVLGNYRVPKTGALTVLQPKTDFAIYKVDVDEDLCINCGKCGDEHTASQRGFWDPRNPRNMVSLDTLLKDLHGKIPKSWFSDQGGPVPSALKEQGESQGDYVYFPEPSSLDKGHQHCNGCLYCVIECPVDAIRVTTNDYYTELTGRDFTREEVKRINEEARTGEVPTSGTGSTGLFGGKGFDRFMFDFSVIVRPTRDGIREAIDIGINLGRKPLFHLFEAASKEDRFPRLRTHVRTLDLPTPLLLQLPTLRGRKSEKDLVEVFIRCANRESTILFLSLFQFLENFAIVHRLTQNVGLRVIPEELETIKAWSKKDDVDGRLLNCLKGIPLLEIVHEVSDTVNIGVVKAPVDIRERLNPGLVVSHLLVCPLNSDPGQVANQVAALAESGAEMIHISTQFNPEKGYYEAVDLIPACYDRLSSKSLHTQVSLIANGIKSPADLGIAMMLGASALVVDRAAVVAVNHEFAMLEKRGERLPEVEIQDGLLKLQNLFKSWHKQLREVLGAFGVRDIRRTVGETGRLIDLRVREEKMRSIVEDKQLRSAARKVNQEKIAEDGDAARQASWKFSELSKLVRAVPPPNATLLGERAASLKSMLQARGDRRWNADMLTATWRMASGTVPSHKVPQTGCDIGPGSFDVMKFAPVALNRARTSLETAVAEIADRIFAGDRTLLQELDAISISAGVINKHRRAGSPPSVNHFPIDAADMSLGSIGWKLTLARYLAGTVLKRYTGTGEGGYPLENYDRLPRFFPNLSRDELHWLASQMERWVATQTATGYFGVSEDTIRRANKLVLKFAQGAKPGLGGHILGAKVTTQVEDLRGVIAGISVFSPFPFHDVYSIEDVTKMIDWLRTINPDVIISVKISTPIDVYHVALGLVTAGADEIQIDATAGGTGAAPDIARNRIAMPLEYGLSDVHKFLVEQGERNKVTLVASGGIRSAYDMAKAIILGADKVILGTQEIVAQQCNRCGNCEAPGGCQKGITTTVEQLEEQKEILLNAQWLINSQVAVVQHLISMMYAWGIKDIRELRGRTDLISEWGWENRESGRRKMEDSASKNNDKSQIFVSEWDSSKIERKELDACGVVSFVCTKAVPVESIQTACQQMHNRGNGRGGGILGLGGMFSEVLEDCYALQIITLVPEKQRQQKILEIAKNHLKYFDIFDHCGRAQDAKKLTVSTVERYRNPRRQKDGRDITWQEAGLRADPGDLFRFFVRVKKDVLLNFAHEVLEKCKVSDSARAILENGHPTDFLQEVRISGKWIDYYVKYVDVLTEQYLNEVDPTSGFWQDPNYEGLWRDLEDEFVYRQAFEINQKYYIEPQDRSHNPEAFVVSMMKDGGIWKLVGYAEQAADYWIVGDAQYLPSAELPETVAMAFKKEVQNEEVEWQMAELGNFISEFKTGGKVQRTKKSRFVEWQVRTNQIEIDLTLKKDKRIRLTIPRYGEWGVVTYKYGAHIWIGHQRFPTVFSPFSGGSHPFYGRVYEALIHNGDFANYVAMVRFWDQFGGAPQFRTDTEMAAKAYAILKQMGYPQPYIFETIAPTTGIDMQRLKNLSPQLAVDFEILQKTHIAGSPDGPWFFIIGDQDPVTRDLKVVGLTDTSVLRPSVFVWQESGNGKYAAIGLVGSEEQACRSVLDTLHQSGILGSKEPDSINIIRGGSVEQNQQADLRGGGAVVYNLKRKKAGLYEFAVTDKFGNRLDGGHGTPCDPRSQLDFSSDQVQNLAVQLFNLKGNLRFKNPKRLLGLVKANLRDWEYNTFRWFVEALGNHANSDAKKSLVIDALSLTRDRIQQMDVGRGRLMKKRSSLIQIVSDELNTIFDQIESVHSGSTRRTYYRVTSGQDQVVPECDAAEKILVVDASGFPPDGHESLARTLIQAYDQGWRKFIVYRITGQRYLGAGFGPDADDVEIHLYGSPGQDIANSMMGGKLHVHADAQNDMAKILHSGTVVVQGLAGNTGVYGAKGGEVYVRDSVGTRWVINSVSSPAGPGLKVVIVGSAMEYLAESLMGGLVLMLGLEWDESGVLRRKYRPFAGNSILAGASAGKVIIYDPDDRIEKAQYANAVDMGFLSRDWLAVFKNLEHLVQEGFSPEVWFDYMQRWRTLAKHSLRYDAWPSQEKQAALVELVDLMESITDSEGGFQKLRQDAMKLKAVVEDRFTGKEWRTLVRQLGQILANTKWQDGIELLERMMDWKEVGELLQNADEYFGLGLTSENGSLFLSVDGQQTEIRREDFKVLRPLYTDEKKRLQEEEHLRAQEKEDKLFESQY